MGGPDREGASVRSPERPIRSPGRGLRAFGVAGAGLLLTSCAATPAPSSGMGMDVERAAEAERLRTVADVRRRGDALILLRQGRSALVLKDRGVCEGFDTCRRWTYLGERRFGGARRRLIEVFHGEGADVHAYDDRGAELVFAREPLPSPDGRFVVTSGPDELEEFSFVIHQAEGDAAPEVAGGFPYGCCRVLGWDGSERIRVAVQEGERLRTGWVLRQADGTWLLQED